MRLSTKAVWCSRVLLESQFIALCVTEKQYLAELRRLKIEPDEAGPFVKNGYGACCHFFENHDSLGRACIVCIQPTKTSTLEQCYALLLHEAVHIWQSERRQMNEHDPSAEFEAYSIQSIAQGLFLAFRQFMHAGLVKVAK